MHKCYLQIFICDCTNTKRTNTNNIWYLYIFLCTFANNKRAGTNNIWYLAMYKTT